MNDVSSITVSFVSQFNSLHQLIIPSSQAFCLINGQETTALTTSVTSTQGVFTCQPPELDTL